MSLSTGIIGLANSGKSTLFNAITHAGADVASYPFSTIEPNIGVVNVPDERLDRVAGMVKSSTVIPATARFVDIAGLVRGASRGEGLGNQFLGQIRNVDAIVHLIRLFEEPTVSHPEGGIDPLRDVEVIEAELCLADLEYLDRQIEGIRRAAKAGKPPKELEVLEHAHELLGTGCPLVFAELDPEEHSVLAGFDLLTIKPVVYVANVGEADLPEGGPTAERLVRFASERGAIYLALCAKLEAELAELSPDEEAEFLGDWGLDEPGLKKLIGVCYRTLGLISFFTIESDQTRAWTLSEGVSAPQAAGGIHTDMERGFVRAEVVSYQDLQAAGSLHRAREQGHLRLEGRNYRVHDGDVITFRFAV